MQIGGGGGKKKNGRSILIKPAYCRDAPWREAVRALRTGARILLDTPQQGAFIRKMVSGCRC